MTVRYDHLNEACAALHQDAEEARVGAFVRVQGAHFAGNGLLAEEVSWVKMRRGVTFTLYQVKHDQRAVVVSEDARGIFGEVFENMRDAAHAFNAEVLRATTR